uniref:putative uncharacterized membrane protein YNL228W n=1 Tax=Saccharomyces cerevisiae (strain ATCC 204508 / S288c) TaxID=559292 RepID=YNW8_YEAST|nr:RecName: Full=putative uncharacterized membrane protein YNL228W; Flags: Precursor [Saccharomyces cerevisiae S288C]CAA93370.1 N1249 [Saccharomyces cerevisiae]CAA96131.1 unnamed protein product [Saccharomyces cerevisiae]
MVWCHYILLVLTFFLFTTFFTAACPAIFTWLNSLFRLSNDSPHVVHTSIAEVGDIEDGRVDKDGVLFVDLEFFLGCLPFFFFALVDQSSSSSVCKPLSPSDAKRSSNSLLRLSLVSSNDSDSSVSVSTFAFFFFFLFFLFFVFTCTFSSELTSSTSISISMLRLSSSLSSSEDDSASFLSISASSACNACRSISSFSLTLSSAESNFSRSERLSNPSVMFSSSISFRISSIFFLCSLVFMWFFNCFSDLNVLLQIKHS